MRKQDVSTQAETRRMKPRNLLLSLLFAASAEATNLIVPAAGPLVLTNGGAEPVPVMLTFHGPDGYRTVDTILLSGSETIDVPPAATMIRISAQGGARVTEHAASLEAVSIDALATEHVLNGSVVVANPWKVPASLIVTMGDQQLFKIVPPLDVLQIETAGASARITSQIGVYAYDDRSFVSGTAHTQIAPPCAEPAPLMIAEAGQQAGGWVVIGDAETYVAELTPPQLAALRCNASVQLIAQSVIAPSQP